MKRCPQCNRAETEETLTFCRVDGTPLVRENVSAHEGTGTVKFSPAQGADTSETRILPTAEALNRPTSPTTELDARRASDGAGESGKSKARRTVVIVASLAIVLPLAGFLYYSLSRRNTRAIDSVAVLPFVNASGDPNLEYLSDGVTESLINSLSQLPNLSVKARSTVFRYKGREADPQKVGSELNVQAVLSGRMTQRGDDLVLSLELVDSRTGDQIWGEQYRRRLSDLVALQGEIARDVSDRLRLKLSGAEEQRLAKNYTSNSEAYQLYLKGRFYWNKRTGAGLNQAADYFRQAIERDPNYALAYAGLADCYVLRPGKPLEGPSKAKEAAAHALALDPTLAEAHASLGMVKTQYDHDWAGARAEFEEAVRLNPKYATAHQWYGILLSVLGRPDEALAEINRAIELDPLSLIINTDKGRILYYAHRYDEAITQLQEALRLDADFGTAHNILGWCYAEKGMYDQAVAEVQKARDLGVPGGGTLSRMAYAYARAGKRAEAQKLLAELEQVAEQSYVSSYSFAAAYAGLGEREKAFVMLQRGLEEKASGMSFIKIDPVFDPLRPDPRFAELVRRMGLPQ